MGIDSVTLILLHALLLPFCARMAAKGDEGCNGRERCMSTVECVTQNRDSDSIHFGCGPDLEKVCCPPRPPMRLTDPEQNKKLLPMTDCGMSFAERVIGGKTAELGQFPWMALIAIQNGTSDLEYHCGGTLINERYILTAAHCLTGVNSNTKVFVRLGENDLNQTADCDLSKNICADQPVDVEVETVIAHSGFSSETMKNDIALLRLKKSVHSSPYIQPICLPFGHNITGEEETKKYQASGWGRTGDNSARSSELLFASLTNYPVSECDLKQLSEVRPIDQTQLCAGGISGMDTCKGDSGGPLMDYLVGADLQAHAVQVGIVSFRSGGCGSEDPSVFTRVHAYLTWILANLEP